MLFRHILPRLLLSACAVAALGCGENSAPVLSRVDDQKAFVGSELVVALRATDDDGDELEFDFDSSYESLKLRGSMDDDGDGRALFRWTPLLTDVGEHAIDFQVEDEEGKDRETITITVTPAGEGSTAPVFVQPLGSGTTLNLDKQSCVDVPLLVEDPDTPGVVLGQQEPLVANAELDQQGELNGVWSFCPSKEQVAADDRYTVTFFAEDGDNPRTLKSYLVVLQNENSGNCPGAPPQVSHTPQDVQTVNGVTITAMVSDDLGIKYEPLLYYSLTAPTDPPDVTTMTQLTMQLVDGDMTSGSWAVDIPNPVANDPGASAQLHYVIVAKDNDDAEGTCDHTTQAPSGSSYTTTVSNGGGGGGLGLCAACTADVQCGNSGDNCIFLDNDYHCFSGCTDDSQCPGGYYCSVSQFTSIDNNVARQCIPDTFQCSANNACLDDSYEENDSLAQASSAPLLQPGNYPALTSCTENNIDDEDWFRIEVTSEAEISASIVGEATNDLDLTLVDSMGSLIVKSDSLSSNESVTSCLSPGTYYLRVLAYGNGQNNYTLNYSQAVGNCGMSCNDDSEEDDDNASQARPVNPANGYTSFTNAICSDDEDWYGMQLFSGETLYATLTFLQSNAYEDLDLYIYKDGVNLTDCSEANPNSCDPTNGQSGTSDEVMVWPITSSGTYELVVHGWAGAENLYDICIGLSASDCP